MADESIVKEEVKAPEPPKISEDQMGNIRIPGELLKNMWDEGPVATIPIPQKAEEKAEPAPTPQPTPTQTVEDADVIEDADEYLRKETGWDNWEAAKAAKAELEEFRKAPKPEPAKYTAEERDRLFDEVFPVLQQKKTLERAEKLEVNNIRNAEEILKLNLQFKYKDLTPDEIDRKFSKQFPIPAKPKQLDTQTNEEYAQTLGEWEAQVQDLQKDIIIEAKLAKPELSRFKSEIVMPELPKPEPEVYKPTDEEMAMAAKVRKDYLEALDPGLNSFTGYSAKAKDEAAEVEAVYAISDEERKTMRKDLETFDHIGWLESRWATKDGRVNVQQLAQDKYLLENAAKIFQKIANEAASKRLEAYMKQIKNVDVVSGGADGSVKLNPEPPKDQNHRQKEVEYLWANG